MAAEVSTKPSFTTRATTPVFQDLSFRDLGPEEYRYDVSADGRRFVLVETVQAKEGIASSIHIVQNWHEEFRDREQD